MSEQLSPPTKQRKRTKRKKDKFPEVHVLVFKATFTTWVIYEFLKFLRFLWRSW